MGVGGDFDFLMRTDFHRMEHYETFDTYTAEVVFEIDSEVGVRWEYLKFY